MTYTLSAPTTDSARIAPIAAATTLVTFGLDTFGIYGDGSKGTDRGLGELLGTFGFTVVAAAVVFALVVPWAMRRPATGAPALTLAVLGALSVPVFWAGITPVLGVGAVILGLAGRDRDRGHAAAQVALVVGLLALIGCVAMYALDWMSTHGLL